MAVKSCSDTSTVIAEPLESGARADDTTKGNTMSKTTTKDKVTKQPKTVKVETLVKFALLVFALLFCVAVGIATEKARSDAHAATVDAAVQAELLKLNDQ